MRPALRVVVAAQLLRRLGDRASRPPAADCPRDAPEQGAHGTSGRTDARAEEHAGDSTRCLTDLVAQTRLASVRSQRCFLRALESSIGRASLDALLSLIH